MLYNRETTFNLDGIMFESGAWYMEQARRGNGKMVGFFHKGDDTARFSYRGKTFWQDVLLLETHNNGDWQDLQAVGVDCYNYISVIDSLTAQKYLCGLISVYDVVSVAVDRLHKAKSARMRDAIKSDIRRGISNSGNSYKRMLWEKALIESAYKHVFHGVNTVETVYLDSKKIRESIKKHDKSGNYVKGKLDLLKIMEYLEMDGWRFDYSKGAGLYRAESIRRTALGKD